MTTEPSIWHNRDVVLSVSGASVNDIGDWLLELALPLYVFIETGSGMQTAAVYLLRLGVGSLFGPLGGRLADTWRLKSTLVITNLLQILALAPLLFVSQDRVWPIAIVVVLQGLISSVNDPASFALLPRLVEGDQLVAANSAFSAGLSISRLIGAAAGGIAIEVGGMTTVAVLDGATFLVGAGSAALLSAKADQRSVVTEEAKSDTSVRAAVHEVRSRPKLTALLWIEGIASLIYGGFPVLFIVFVTEYLDGSAGDVGILRAAPALGGLLAAGVIAGVASKITPARLMSAGYLLFALLSALFINAASFTTALWVYLLLYGATGLSNVAAGVGIRTTTQQLTPPEVMGRVGGLKGTVSKVGFGLGATLSGILLEITNARTLLNIEAAMFLLCAAIGYLYVVRAPTQTTEPRCR